MEHRDTLFALTGCNSCLHTAKSITERDNLMRFRGRSATPAISSTASNVKAGETRSGELPAFCQDVTYLKEMAGVSRTIARKPYGQVKPLRSHTLATHRENGEEADWCGFAHASRRSPSASGIGAMHFRRDSAKIGLRLSSAIDKVTSTMHEMKLNVQNMVKILS